jgi:hypothetical protein
MNRGCGAFCPAPYNLASLGPVPLPSVALSISAGVFHTCALLDTFDVYCWGSNSYGQLGPSAIGASGSSPLLYAMGASTYAPSKSPGAPTPPTRRPSASPSASPHPPTGFANTYDAIAMGGHQTCVLAHYNSALQCFGKYDAVEELSDGLLSGKRASSAYLADEDFNCYVRLPDSKLICVGPLWLAGSPNFRIAPGYVSDFSGALVEHEISLPSGLKPQFVSSSEYNTCVMFTTGRVSCWGNGGSVMGSGNAEPHGVVDGDMGDALPFVDLGTGLTATRLSMGAYHACVLLSPTNVVKCWGGNWEGFLGTENSVDIGGSPNQMGNKCVSPLRGRVNPRQLACREPRSCRACGGLGRWPSARKLKAHAPRPLTPASWSRLVVGCPRMVIRGLSPTSNPPAPAATALLNTSRVVCWGTNICALPLPRAPNQRSWGRRRAGD